MLSRASTTLGALLFGSILISPLSASYQGATCGGCESYVTTGSGAFAPSPCSDVGILADWEISVSVDAFDGKCIVQEDGKTIYCAGYACQTSVSYVWGAAVAGAGLSIGYYEDGAERSTLSEIVFNDPPWTPGQFGAVTFDSNNSPEMQCGKGYQFFISGNACGPFKADVFANCSACNGSMTEVGEL